MTEETTVVKAPEAGEDESTSSVDKVTLSEIDMGVDAVLADQKKDSGEAAAAPSKEGVAKEDLPPGEEEPGDDKEKDVAKTDAEEDDASVISDSQLERAVKAGMTLADARAVKDAEALGRICSTLEARKKAEGGEADDANTGDAEDILSQIPDLDPETFDENLVAGFKAVKNLASALQAKVKRLESAGASRDGSWFDTQVANLGEEISTVLKDQPTKAMALKEKFDVLSAGYEAAGKDVGQSVVLAEAVAVVLGDVAAKAEATVKSKKLETRRKQHVSRPSGGADAPKADPFDETAREIHEKYFKNE